MKRMLIITLFLSLFLACLKAPEFRTVYIAIPEEINYYTPLIEAVTWVETKDGLIVYNPLEEAVGWFQIRQCRVDHYNQLTGSNYVLSDFYDYDLSRKMFLYFCKDRDYESVAKSWNGSGPLTKIYWQKVKARL